MQVGVNHPRAKDERLERVRLERVRDVTGIRAVRYNTHYANPHNDANTETVMEAGCHPLPILGVDRQAVVDADRSGSEQQFARAMSPYLDFVHRFVPRHRFAAVETLNEPWVLAGAPKIPPLTYAKIANATGDHVRQTSPDTDVWVAGEMLTPDRKGPRKLDWWAEMTRGLMRDLYRGVAIHPYREPAAPEVARIGGRSIASLKITSGSRAAEMEWCREQAGDQKIVHVTEVGWRVGESVSEQRQAEYLVRELDLLLRLGVVFAYIYADWGDPALDFGLLRSDGSPRPAAHAVRRWIEAHR
tara:strand:- start:11025 stop:11927 length:903 start_codon:yes stop_codon:yes gene_type:complete